MEQAADAMHSKPAEGTTMSHPVGRSKIVIGQFRFKALAILVILFSGLIAFLPPTAEGSMNDRLLYYSEGSGRGAIGSVNSANELRRPRLPCGFLR
jgi:hypothetical protein